MNMRLKNMKKTHKQIIVVIDVIQHKPIGHKNIIQQISHSLCKQGWQQHK